MSVRIWPAVVCALLFTAGSAAAQQPPRLGALHDALHLTPVQEDAWRAYTGAIASNTDADARHRAAERLMPTLTTPKRIALIDATMSADMADLRRQGVAVIAFYGQLTPDQQQIFDRQTLQSEDRSAQ
jgi:hypothetical protein